MKSYKSDQREEEYADLEEKKDNPVGLKKRGRKRTEDEKYFEWSRTKINNWMKQLVAGKDLTPKEKQKLRNRISALKSRMAKKLELT